MLSTERRRRRRWRRAPSTRAAAWRHLPVRRAARHPRGHACAANARACLERAARGRARAPSLGRRALGYGSLERARDGDDGGGGGGYVRRVRRRGGVVITRTGVAGPYTHESRHLLISNASHMYNERNRLTRQVSRAPQAVPRKSSANVSFVMNSFARPLVLSDRRFPYTTGMDSDDMSTRVSGTLCGRRSDGASFASSAAGRSRRMCKVND